MVDPLLDPLDMMPVDRPTPKSAHRYRESAQAPGETFGDILSKKIDLQPTPVMTPDALRVPEIKAKPKKDIAVPQENQPVGNTANKLVETSSHIKNESVNSHAIEEPVPTPELKPTDILPINLLDILNMQIDNKQPEEPKAPKVQVAQEKTAPTVSTDNDAKPTKAETVNHQTSSQEITSKETTNPETPQPDISRPDSTYIIQSGDTLSHIVSSSLRESGQEFSTRDVYQLVNMIAAHNGIDNPDRIYAGNQLDLEPLYSGQFIAQDNIPQNTAMAGELQSPVNGYITSDFGLRQHPISKQEHFHTGIDIGVPTGTPVMPVTSGQVVFSGEKGGFGRVIEIDHNDGTHSIYGHLSDLMVQKGDQIEAHDVIALSGDTGRSTGPHLHLEIQRAGVAIDPLTVISRNDIESAPRQIARGDIR